MDNGHFFPFSLRFQWLQHVSIFFLSEFQCCIATEDQRCISIRVGCILISTLKSQLLWNPQLTVLKVNQDGFNSVSTKYGQSNHLQFLVAWLWRRRRVISVRYAPIIKKVYDWVSFDFAPGCLRRMTAMPRGSSFSGGFAECHGFADCVSPTLSKFCWVEWIVNYYDHWWFPTGAFQLQSHTLHVIAQRKFVWDSYASWEFLLSHFETLNNSLFLFWGESVWEIQGIIIHSQSESLAYESRCVSRG